jgi:glyoxylase-like metal-dependent hydrolase (beta-lactamase superfamily II)
MLERVHGNIYKGEVPLPNNPLRSLNSYLVLGGDRVLIVDTGYNRPESQAVFYGNLRRLSVSVEEAMVVITHFHSDHSGLAQELYQRGAKIFMSRGDGERAKLLKQDSYWQAVGKRLRMLGLEEGPAFLRCHPGRLYGPAGDFNFTAIKEGDQLVVGDYRFEIISVPGHTPDMINLYDREKGVYFAGDHILDPITPHIGFWGFKEAVILNQYLTSLRKTYNKEIRLMLPGHRDIIWDHRKRIDELLAHHGQRLQEIEDILWISGAEMTVAEVARKMQWRIKANGWDALPPAQKTFALGETMSHLEYLAYQKRVQMEVQNGYFYFSLLN